MSFVVTSSVLRVIGQRSSFQPSRRKRIQYSRWCRSHSVKLMHDSVHVLIGHWLAQIPAIKVEMDDIVYLATCCSRPCVHTAHDRTPMQLTSRHLITLFISWFEIVPSPSPSKTANAERSVRSGEGSAILCDMSVANSQNCVVAR
uniref:Uncharacterized protein n=1 Tax=Haptolina brevifila TaxID=156173 RepID=A0A7S2IGD0_9EUKA